MVLELKKVVGRVAANLWAKEATRVTMSADAIKVAEADARGMVSRSPEVPVRFLAGAWYAFCRELNANPRAVWFSAGRGESLRLGLRGRCRVNSMTGAGVESFYDSLLSGEFAFTVRYDPRSRALVNRFIQALDQGWFRLGQSRSVYGWVSVVETRPIGIAEAKAFEVATV